MRFVREWWHRLVAWRRSRIAVAASVIVPDFVAYVPNISRDVSPRGVRFFSLCGTCGERMESSATLCDDCARKRTGFSTNY